VTTYDLVAVGDVMLDVLAPELADRPRHGTIEIGAGGSSVNAARAAVAVGRTAVVVGCVGDDAAAGVVVHDLETSRIDTRLATIGGARTGRTVYAGDAVAVERGANGAFSPGHVPGDVEGRTVLVSGYQLLRDDSGEGARAAFACGGVIGVDLGRAGVVRGFGTARARAAVEGADVLFGDEAAIAELGDVAGTLAVTTLGPAGARAGGVHAYPRETHASPLVGAGDAFAAAFLLALVDGASISDALQRGCDTGAAVGRR
jgi:sugar/nucleoside kinase (ribokinase family)